MTKARRKPLRKCIVTKEMKVKNELIRIVRTKDGQVFVDPTGKQNGRGAYLSKDLTVIEKAQSENVLSKLFKVKIADEIYEELKEMVED